MQKYGVHGFMPPVWLAAACLTALAGCGSPTGMTPPPPPPVDQLAVHCAANVLVEEVKVPTLAVAYSEPTVTGGVPPVSAPTCAPQSGSSFPLGTTTVTCTATQGVGAPATCSLTVTLVPFVPPIPFLNATRFLAFGDSLTAGENGIEGPDVACTSSLTGAHRLFIDLCHSYPSVLQDVLRQRYTDQTPVVVNRGAAGEGTAEGAARLPGLLAGTSPDALLLLEGVNDLPDRPDDVIRYLRDDIQLAKSRGLKKVFLSTLIPQKAGFRNRAIDAIAPTNVRIRALAAEQGVILVDNEAAFLARGDLGALVEDDGLHCTPEGYRVMAQTFFAAIQTAFEQAGAAALRRAARQR